MRKVLMIGFFTALALFAVGAGIIAYILYQFASLEDPAASASGEPPAVAEADLAGARDLTEILEPIRRKHELPALAAAVVKGDRTAALGAVGVRRAGGKERVGINDCFHIGSCTKSMTATLCAILIEKGKLKWDSTIGEVFSKQADEIHPDYHSVTLEQLLMHRSGLPEDRAPDPILWPKIRALRGRMIIQRKNLVELVLAQKPVVPAGTKHQYSNSGYTIAGAMCERVEGKAWEDLMREHQFAPLGMTTAGFGAPGKASRIEQPWGHLVNVLGWKPVPPGKFADNPAVIGPAGTVHCSIGDWAKYAAFHLRGAQGKEPTLSKETFQKLHTPLAGDDEKYAFGWAVMERGWAGGKAIMHTGSNTMWFAVVWIAPERDMAFVAATNVGTNEGFLGCDAAITKLLEIVSVL